MLLAAAICYLVTPYVETYALRFGAIARVRTRDIHTETTPRWGGVSMWFATSFTFVVVSHLPLVGKSFGREAQGIFLAATFVVLLGMIDDRYELDALTKLAGQTVAAGILLTFGVQLLWLPINGLITLPPSIGQFLTVLVILVAINAVNFIDGMDGLASGVVAVAATAFFIFAYVLAVVYGFSRAGAPSTISAVLIGVCLGFLPHNAYPAKIFMGDTGSLALGGALAGLAASLRVQLLLIPLGGLFVIITLSVALQVIYFRLTGGKRLFKMAPLQHHFELMGWGEVTIVLRFWIIAGLSVALGLGLFYTQWVAS